MKYLLIVASMICLIMFQNCAPKVDFRPEALSQVESTTFSSTEEFSSEAQNSPLDMIWVIDNSSSMSEEAAAVRANFQNFLEVLNHNTNFRLLLISLNSGPFGVSIPSQFSSNTHIQINTKVDSENGPEILIATLKNPNLVPTNFFRKNAKKVIVFVTDDQSDLNSTKVMALLPLNKTLYSVYGFVGLGNSVSPCQETTGTVYKDLATKTGGKVYNICNADWSASFSNLLTSSIIDAKRNFVLSEANITQIVSVNVDKVPLPASSYTLTGQSVTISKDVVLNVNSMISVTYMATK